MTGIAARNGPEHNDLKSAPEASGSLRGRSGEYVNAGITSGGLPSVRLHCRNHYGFDAERLRRALS
jgi:hypothetical protein